MGIYTYQDFEAERDTAAFVGKAIGRHEASELCRTARLADLYDRQRNPTIESYVQTLFTLSGEPLEDFTASNNKIACNLFNRLNTQRVLYSLGNGVSFLQAGEDGADDVKSRLGPRFDHDVKEAAYMACIHGVSFCFWDLDRIHVFPVTQFAPLWDELTGELRAGIRFWRLAPGKPRIAVLYEEDGYTRYETDGDDAFRVADDGKRPYKTTYSYIPAEDHLDVVGEENYGRLPIVPMWASRLKQSTLVGMRSAIDSYDLIRSGFANDLADCSMVYWIVENAGGMSDEDLARFRDRLKVAHIANVRNGAETSIRPFVQDVPYQARSEYLRMIRDGIYEDFGALDVHAVAAGATNDHIDAAYQPLDENAADFEYWVSECIMQILALAGIEDRPEFRRNRISNQAEQVQMLVQEAQWLDQQTILRKLPNVGAEEVAAIMQAVQDEDAGRFGMGGAGEGAAL